MSNVNYYTTLVPSFIGMGLFRIQYKIPQQRNIIRKLEEDGGAKMLFITERQQQYILNFSLDSLNIIKNKQ